MAKGYYNEWFRASTIIILDSIIINYTCMEYGSS